jgi:hypothetical protein
MIIKFGIRSLPDRTTSKYAYPKIVDPVYPCIYVRDKDANRDMNDNEFKNEYTIYFSRNPLNAINRINGFCNYSLKKLY